jgi:hypothetical protein
MRITGANFWAGPSYGDFISAKAQLLNSTLCSGALCEDRRMRVYCDTNVLRYFSSAFATGELPQRIRENVVVSSISAVELLSQLCESSANQAFAAVQSLINWLPERVPLLDLPPIFIRLNTLERDERGDATFEKISNALNWCLRVRSPEELRDASKELRNFLQNAKLADAQARADSVTMMRADLRRLKRRNLTDEELRVGFRASIAKRAGIDPTHPGVTIFAEKVEAFYQYETIRLQRAIENLNLNLLSKKRQNDLFDAEQLLYLFAENLCFLTCDRGYSELLKLAQGTRIRIAKPDALMTANSAIPILNEIVAA